MSSSSSTSRSSGPVRISYPTLLSDPASLLPSIAQAFGSEEGCLGIILIEGGSAASAWPWPSPSESTTSLCISWLCVACSGRSEKTPTFNSQLPSPNSHLVACSLQLAAPDFQLPPDYRVDLTACTTLLGPHPYRPPAVPAIPAVPAVPAVPASPTGPNHRAYSSPSREPPR
jgi:hypothetical protein